MCIKLLKYILRMQLSVLFAHLCFKMCMHDIFSTENTYKLTFKINNISTI